MRILLASLVCVAIVSCSGKSGDKPTCGNGLDPDSPQCNLPQCMDGIDNDGDGKIDYPDDPGCTSPNQDSEVDDCPSGPNCPECGNGIDDDGNGLIDYPDDPGCESASDPIEFTENPEACGTAMLIKQLPASGMDTGMFDASNVFPAQSPCGGGGGGGVIAVAYEVHLLHPQVLQVSSAGSSIHTVIDLRGPNCQAPSSEIACTDAADLTSIDTLTASLKAGTYFILVESYSGDVGSYAITVQEFAGVGTPCTDASTCGPGLVCRVPLGGSQMVCSNPECSDGVDDDGDGKADYPDDPGCASPDDNDETDDCPSGPNCPQCGNGKDDDGDGNIDYPMDPKCKAASDASEICKTTEGVQALTAAMTSGDTTNASDDETLACAFGTGGKDLTYQLAVPKLTALSIAVTDPNDSFFPDYALYGASCGGTALDCESSDPIALGAVAAGDYYLVVDGDDDTQYGTFQIAVAGTIANGASCESLLAQSGALACATGYACKGTMGSRTCQKAQCSDGIDNNGDGKIDYPNDPGCDSPSDDTETTVCPGAQCPVCSNGLDDDADGKTDYPADFGCSSAAGASEVFCMMETDPVAAITAATTSGTLANLHHDLTLDCQSDTGNDKTYALELPVPVQSLTINTTGSTIADTVLEVWDTQCDTPGIACNDDDSAGTLSSITLTNLPGGNYAVTVAGFSTTNNGAFKLNVSGTVAKGTACTGTLFTNNVLKCASGSTCTSGKCQ